MDADDDNDGIPDDEDEDDDGDGIDDEDDLEGTWALSVFCNCVNQNCYGIDLRYPILTTLLFMLTPFILQLK